MKKTKNIFIKGFRKTIRWNMLFYAVLLAIVVWGIGLITAPMWLFSSFYVLVGAVYIIIINLHIRADKKAIEEWSQQSGDDVSYAKLRQYKVPMALADGLHDAGAVNKIDYEKFKTHKFFFPFLW